MQRVMELGPGPQAIHEVSRLWLQATSTSLALANGNSGLHQRSTRLEEELFLERAKVITLEKVFRELRPLATAANHLS
ncbi:hypothetical protein LIER_14707 [Lithospermum erythrorhizon]|uniref:Uncharacterized protein n=1 Tax=Lithospermum erythrorhizon TaxID=34254 RepID=A0AAV3Q079_LITER